MILHYGSSYWRSQDIYWTHNLYLHYYTDIFFSTFKNVEYHYYAEFSSSYSRFCMQHLVQSKSEPAFVTRNCIPGESTSMPYFLYIFLKGKSTIHLFQIFYKVNHRLPII